MTLFEAFRDKGGFGGLKISLDRAGVDMSKMNASSIASLAQLWSGDDDAIRAQAKKLLGMDGIKGNKALEGQLSGSGQDLKNAVLKLTSLYDVTKDEGSAARQAQIDLENKFKDYADELLPIMTKVKDGVLALASKSAPESAVAKQAYADEELSRIRASIADSDGGDFQAFLIRGARARQSRLRRVIGMNSASNSTHWSKRL